MKFPGIAGLCSVLILSGCGGGSSSDQDSGSNSSQTVLSSSVSIANSYEDIADAAVWEHPTDVTRNRLIVALEGDGLAVFNAEGKQVWHNGGFEAIGADIRYGLSDNQGASIDLVAVALPDEAALAFFSASDDDQPLDQVGYWTLPIEPAGVCLYKNLTTGNITATAFDESGEVLQYKLAYDGVNLVSAVTDTQGAPLAVRSLSVGGELSACAVDDVAGTLFIAEQNLGIWAYGADPENVKERALVDGISPLGALQEIEGIDLTHDTNGDGILYVGDEGAGLLAYRLSDYSLLVQTEVNGFIEIKSLAASSDSLWLANTELDAPVYERLNQTDVIALIQQGGAYNSNQVDPRDLDVEGVQLVTARGETTEVDDDGDAADDPAFWLNEDSPSDSLIIATNKQGGLMAYTLSGDEVQYLEGGEPNNIDIRQGLIKPDSSLISLAAASNRELNTLSFYSIQSASNNQTPIQPLPAQGSHVHAEADELISSVDEVYGLCMYQAEDGTPYVFVNGKDGTIEQWRLTLTNDGVEGAVVRTLSVDSQPEGCVADDEAGILYVGEEDVAIWSFDAHETGPTDATQIAAIDGMNLVADVEGLTLFNNGTQKYLIASSQGNNTYVVYDVLNNHTLLGTFAIVGDDNIGVDGASDTDGIHVVSANLGSDYPEGMMIAQDWYNIDAEYQTENQNFKMVSWKDIRESLELP